MAIKKIHILQTLFIALITSACQLPPGDNKATVIFEGDNCIYNGPDGSVENPITFTFTNKMENEQIGMAVVTLEEGYTQADLEAYQWYGAPHFLDHFIDLLYTSPGKTETRQVTLDIGRKNYLVCGHESGRVISVLAVLTP